MTFYKAAFGAEELRRWDNPDGSVHVAELSINGALFHLHQEVQPKQQLSAQALQSTSVILGLFVPDPHSFVDKAVAAGAQVISPVQDYDYDYRQGTIRDPFSHQWLIQKKI